jgi:hypothetical protein
MSPTSPSRFRAGRCPRTTWTGLGGGSVGRTGRAARVRDSGQRDRDVQQVDVPQARHLEALGEGPVVDVAEHQLENLGEIGVVDLLAADERVLVADP